jgi:glyoxylase-like metal-dependent hydrolase (beta-lactamase superfamily II)
VIQRQGSRYINWYLLEEDDEITFIDAGLPGYWSAVKPALAALGKTPEDVKAIVLTHVDPDHVGFAGQMQREHGTPVYVHRDDADRAKSGTNKETEKGFPVAMLRHRFAWKGLRHIIKNGGPAKIAPIDTVIAFDDGDVLDVPGRLRAVHTPGHSLGHCVFMAEGQDAILIGDAITNMNAINGQPGPRLTAPNGNVSTEQAYASLARVEELPQRTLYFGHGDPIDRGAAAVVAEARLAR